MHFSVLYFAFLWWRFSPDGNWDLMSHLLLYILISRLLLNLLFSLATFTLYSQQPMSGDCLILNKMPAYSVNLEMFPNFFALCQSAMSYKLLLSANSCQFFHISNEYSRLLVTIQLDFIIINSLSSTVSKFILTWSTCHSLALTNF